MKRWKRGSNRVVKDRRHRAERRSMEVPVYRDKDTGLVLQRWGADRGTPERQLRAGGWTVSSDRVYALLGPAYAAMPGPIEQLLLGGALGTCPPDPQDLIRRRLDAAKMLRETATRAGVQRRTSGRYDVGARGRDASAEEPVRVTRARASITALAEAITWPVLGMLLDLVLFERELPAYPLPPDQPRETPEPIRRIDETEAAFSRRLAVRAAARAAALRRWEALCEDLRPSVEAAQAAWRRRFAGVARALDLVADFYRTPAVAAETKP